MTRTLPQLPCNIGKRRRIKDILENPRYFTILDEIVQIQSTNKEKAIYLQLLEFEDGHRELRLCYYIIAKKGRMKGKWVFPRNAPMMGAKDFRAIIRKAKKKGFI